MQKRFSREFKRAAGAQVQTGESQLSVARHLAICNKTLNCWCVTARRAMPEDEIHKKIVMEARASSPTIM